VRRVAGVALCMAIMLLIHDGGLMGLGGEHDERAVSARAVGLYRCRHPVGAHANVRLLSERICARASRERESAERTKTRYFAFALEV